MSYEREFEKLLAENLTCSKCVAECPVNNRGRRSSIAKMCRLFKFDTKSVEKAEVAEKLFKLKCPCCERNFFMLRNPIAEEWDKVFECDHCSNLITVAMPDHYYEKTRLFNVDGGILAALALERRTVESICKFWMERSALLAPRCAPPTTEYLSDPLEMMGDNLACPMCEHYDVCKLRPVGRFRPFHFGRDTSGRSLAWDVLNAYAMNCRDFKFDAPPHPCCLHQERSEDE